VKLLVSFRHRKAVEPFIGLLEVLRARGHAVTIATHERDEKIPAMFASPDAFTFATLPQARRDAWADGAELVRHLRDFTQYLDGPYRQAGKLRNRAFERLLKLLAVAPEAAAQFNADGLLALGDEAVRRLDTALGEIEAQTPADPMTVRALQLLAPDAVLVTPLIHFGNNQVEVVKAAKTLGIRVGMLLFSWDNLSTKGALHVEPDHLFVWNERQRCEAQGLHGFDPACVSVTGAPRFDRFFTLRSKVDAGAFRAALGVDASTLVILYVCSSRLVSQKEVNFIRQWVKAIRSSDHAPLREALLVVRPHPDLPLTEGKWMSAERTFRWPGFVPEPRARVLFDDPRTVVLTSDYGASDMLYECIFHSRAVVGLNTSAEIEAGIVGRPVFTILTDASHADGQHSTLHFHYLTATAGGFVQTAATLEEHVAALARETEAPAPAAVWQQRVAEFVRPHGWDIPAADVTADAIERVMSAASPVTVTPSVLDTRDTSWRPALTPTSTLDSDTTAVLEWLRDEVSPGEVMYDLTAGTGDLTVAAARECGCTVVAFEANLASLTMLWQRVVAEGCNGLVVPLLVRPGVRTALYQQRFDALQPDASRLAMRSMTWRGHDRPPGAEVIQPVMSIPLAWAVKRWKLPIPSVLRAVLGPDDADLVGAVESLADEGRVRAIVMTGDSRLRALAATRLAGHGFRTSGQEGESMLLLARAAAASSATMSASHD
jgi:hypothetical protein